MGIKQGKKSIRMICANEGFKDMEASILDDGMLSEEIDGLFFDMNTVIYQMFRRADFNQMPAENDFYAHFFRFLDAIIRYAQPKKFMYFGFDGVSPHGKLQSQLNRRLERAYFKEKDSPTVILTKGKKEIDKCEIAPGTIFMEEIHVLFTEYIRELLKRPELKHLSEIILSTHLEAGEGETKIFNYINKCLGKDDRYALYGEDCDLILYSLLNKTENIIVLNHSLWAKPCSVDVFMFEITHIEQIRAALLKKFARYYDVKGFDKYKILRDVILLFQFKGSDYVAGLPGFECNSRILEILLQKYIGNYLCQFDDLTRAYIVEDDKLNLSNLRNYLNQVKCYDHSELWKRKIFYNNVLPEAKMKRTKHRVVNDYLKCLFWSIKLYQTELISWNYKYSYTFPPFLADLEFSDHNVDFSFNDDYDNEPLSPFHNLIYITPKPSIEKVLPPQFEEIIPMSTNSSRVLKIHPSLYNRVFFDFRHDERRIKRRMNRLSITLNENEKERNRLRKSLIIFKKVDNQIVETELEI